MNDKCLVKNRKNSGKKKRKIEKERYWGKKRIILKKENRKNWKK